MSIRESYVKYRRFGRLDWEVSALGFGVAHLPLINNDPANIDEVESFKILRYAIDHGVNYLDIGSPFVMKNNRSLSRPLREALQDGYRQKIKIAASLPSVLINPSYDFEHYLNELLKWLQTDMVDFFLLGGLNRDTWPRVQGLDILRRAEEAVTDKRIGKIGFFFHDQFQFLRDIVEAYDNWALCEFQYSYMDVDHHPGVGGLKYAAEKGLGVVVSSPLLGGRLTREPPEPVAGIWGGAKPKRTLADWGLRWVWNHPEVSTIVCDMSTMEQVKANIALADSIEPERMTVSEELLINQVRDAYRNLRPISCTACRICMPCPQDIDVPRIFELYNDAIMYGDTGTARSIYRLERHHFDNCNECGTCENACGRKLPLLDWLRKARQLLVEDD
jgi:predicted aldo/keto reductase-like oxidoreductase